MINVVRYDNAQKSLWDQFVLSARNSTLLHLRTYMDYHSYRFTDASLIFRDDNGKPLALLPSNIDGDVVYSHRGLTFGGFIIKSELHTLDFDKIFKAALAYYRNNMGASRFVIKPIPYIYSVVPCQEELYFIHQHGGKLLQRNLSQTICATNMPKISELRRRCITKATKLGITISEATQRAEWDKFHSILSSVLKDRHATNPVHTSDELWYLHSCFSDNIKLFVAYEQQEIIAGSIIYISPNVIHTQYLASSPKGQQVGALDLVVSTIINQFSQANSQQYLDFGISTELDGSLNFGLTLQKEGFGGRGVCYDSYSLDL